MSPTEKKAAAHLLRKLGKAFLSRHMEGKVSLHARQLLMEAQEGLCFLCDEPMLSRWRYVDHRDSDTCDHVWPKGYGGHDQPGNLTLTHKKCNGSKGSRFPTRAELGRLKVLNDKLGWPDRTPVIAAGVNDD